MKKLFLFPLLFLSFAQAETIRCKVIGIQNGDTITCLTEQKKQIVSVELYQIDAPEPEQAYWLEAKNALSDLIFNQIVEVKTHTKEGRILGLIYTTPPENCYSKFLPFSEKTLVCSFYSRNINSEMIKQGYVWFDKSFGENHEYQQEQAKAKRGLWVDSNPTPPWEWRKQQIK
ncbi:thermonuclease family protein [Neisseria sp. Ec49-e6-T10]|uniref:thermonuclease family protein n=1 Tax=Neisseria sp. Ec49-e6-T10 TaxID=3140744 RepID=UPI003EBC0EEF